MRFNIHTAIRSLAMAASVIMVPNAALLSHTVAIQVSRGYAHWDLAKEPLPALTEFWITRQAQSAIVIEFALAAAAVLIVTGICCSRLPDSSPRQATGQIVVTILGPIIAVLILSFTIMAALLPAMIVLQKVAK